MGAPKGNKYAVGNRGGFANSKYKPEYCEEIIKFFSVPHTRERLKCRFYDKTGNLSREEFEEVADDLPFFSKFARKIKTTTKTLNKWKEKHPEFCNSYNIAKELQKEFLVNNGLRGMYPPASFIFTAKNITDMKDEQYIDLTKTLDDEDKKRLDKLYEQVDKLNKKNYAVKAPRKRISDVKEDTPMDTGA